MLILFIIAGRNSPDSQNTRRAAQNDSGRTQPVTAAEVATQPATDATITSTSVPTEAPQPTATVGPTSISTSTPEPTIAPSPTTSPTTATIGDREEAGGMAMTLVEAYGTTALNQFLRADAGKEYLVVEVIIENTGRDSAPYNPLYFKLKDDGGFEYNTSLFVGDGGLKSGELARGEKVRGRIAFEISKEAKSYRMTFEPMVLFGGYEPIVFTFKDAE